MVDPTWNGGISETRRVIDLAQTYNIPATIHDCTGPLTLFSGLHLAASSTNVVFQETVRAHIRSFYDKLVDTLPVIEQGKARLPRDRVWERGCGGVVPARREFLPAQRGEKVT